MFLKALFVVAWIAALVLVVFFCIGIADGSVWYASGLWFAMLVGTAAILAGGHALAAKGKRAAAGLVLAILAAPAGLYGFFILLVLSLQPRWN